LKISPGKLIQSRFPLAIVAGLLLASSFPKIGIAGFAWIAPGLILAAALGKRGAESFRIGYVAGLAHYLASLYWLLLIPYRWHGIPLGPAFGWIALSMYLALFPAAWVWLVLKVLSFGFRVSSSTAEQRDTQGAFSSPSPPPKEEKAGERRSMVSNSNPLTPTLSPLGRGEGVASALEEMAAWNWSRRIFWTFSCAASWVAMEMIVVRLFGGFPWNLLGASQYRILPLTQIASVTGVYGVAFLVVWTSVSLLGAAAAIVRRPNSRSVWFGEMIFPMLAVATSFGFGFHRIGNLPAPARELKITLVQPSIPQTLIWNSENDLERFHELLRLSEEALANETDLLIWPEAAIPKMLRYNEEIRGPLLNLARAHRVWMIVGSDDAEPRASSKNPEDSDYFNASFLISPKGEIVERYCKRNLVIFGEYIPLVRWLPFLKWFTPIDGGFTAGDKPGVFEMNIALERRSPDRRESDAEQKRADQEIGAPSETAFRVKTSPLICYEDTFPQIGRESASDDTDFLVNLTNDGWFGEGAAQWQQAACATFRAVENGLPLVRCANTGLTCWVDEAGRIREIFSDKTGSVYGAGFVTMEIPLTENRAPTFYHQHGDWFGWGCVAFSAVVISRQWRARCKSKQ
jgi:apolipoprotein N-acyltransferase